MAQARLPLILTLAHRLWQGGAGLVTVLILTQVLTAEAQGWYYSFLSVAALYTLFDLGLSLVLVQASAHGTVRLRWTTNGYFEGADAGRFSSLIAFATRHYTMLALGFLVIVAPSGWIFFSAAQTPYPGWQPAWLTLAAATAGALMIIPFLALVEGSGDVAGVAAVRLAQAISGSVAAWTVLLSGGGLWATVMPALASSAVGGLWLVLRRGGLLAALTSKSQAIDWKSDIWPLQWRLGLSWLSGYLLTQIHTIVLFSISGALAAGQIGLSMTVGNMIGLLAQSFIARHVPAMARAAAIRDWTEMDRLFNRDFALSTGLFVLGGLACIGLVLTLTDTNYAARILPPLPFAGLMLALLLVHVHGLLAAQLRSYNREPLIWVAVSGAIATLVLAPIAAWLAGAQGTIVVILSVQVILVLPASVVLFRRRNREWRAP